MFQKVSALGEELGKMKTESIHTRSSSDVCLLNLLQLLFIIYRFITAAAKSFFISKKSSLSYAAKHALILRCIRLLLCISYGA